STAFDTIKRLSNGTCRGERTKSFRFAYVDPVRSSTGNCYPVCNESVVVNVRCFCCNRCCNVKSNEGFLVAIYSMVFIHRIRFVIIDCIRARSSRREGKCSVFTVSCLPHCTRRKTVFG